MFAVTNETPAEFCIRLERQVRAEARHAWDAARARWEKPLGERVDSGRAIGPLTITSESTVNRTRLIHFDPSANDASIFREGDIARLSRNDPDGADFADVMFHGLTAKGLTITAPKGMSFATRDGWTLDETVIDLTDLYLRALNELATTSHGRDAVMPALLQCEGDSIDFEEHEEALEDMSDVPLDGSQTDAVATCLASERFHLVQGPPGTGKTHALAHLVEQLVMRGNRVLLCAFTHRAIHHALRKITPLIDCPVFKVSDPFPHDGEGIKFRDTFADTGLLDEPGPYVIGCTPFALFTNRAAEARFDVAVIDETSQLRIEAAIMPMLRARKWFFFGDACQLPPVVLRPVDDPANESVFVALSRKGGHTMLRTTYRMNTPLCQWPSENFYQGNLVADRRLAGHRFTLKKEGPSPQGLGPEPSLVRIALTHIGNRASSTEEADEVAALIGGMLDGGLAPGEIGVVVPFRAHAARIRKLLRFPRFADLPGIADLAVDTVERFQGQEREAVIVSFAVSDNAFMDRLGSFLTYPQRLNVAVTRARTKVILVHSEALHRWLERQAPHDERSALALSLFNSAG